MDKEKVIAGAKLFLNRLFDTRAAALYILLFATSIGIATFIENDYGTSSAQKLIFKSWWFELLLFFFAITIIVNIIKFRMVQNRKWALVLFHASMIIILIGAGVTRYFGYEGIMHIREGDSSNTFLSADTYLNLEVITPRQDYNFQDAVLFATLGNNDWQNKYKIDNNTIDVKVKGFIPNPEKSLREDKNGKPIVKLVLGSVEGRQEYFITQGEQRKIGGLIYNFSQQEIQGAINIFYQNDSLLIKSNSILEQTVMATLKRDTLFPDSGPHFLRLRSLYSDGTNNFVFGDFKPKARLVLESTSDKVKNGSITALVIDAKVNDQTKEMVVFGKKGLKGEPSILKFDDLSLSMSYGANALDLPFRIKLKDFEMERYPGTNSAASYASDVQLIDSQKNTQLDFRIFMNHILDYGGFRFFQSSFDKDEKGTYLSVNYDFWGTWISYFGYFLLTLGLLMVFVSKKSRFYQITQAIKKMRAESAIIILLLIFGNTSNAQKNINNAIDVVNVEHASLFSQIIVQDHKGRMKPMHTLTREVLRKISRSERYNDFNPDQVVLSMFANKQLWRSVPIIKIGKHEELKTILSVDNGHASYSDFFDTNGEYKLRDEVRRAYELQPIDRGMLEKEIMKVDERLNITSMIFSGSLFKVIPLLDDENNMWISSRNENNDEGLDYLIADKFFVSYQQSLQQSMLSGDYSFPNNVLVELKQYQNQFGVDVIPSQTQAFLEIVLNNLNVFGRLSWYYLITGIFFLAMLFISVFKVNFQLDKFIKYGTVVVFLCFLFHTVGLGLRWYVSERAPWSNGYESMIYIAWTTCLAGLIFTRKSTGGLSATMILAGTILLVAKLSYLDPEITPLVPVLKSYWLTIHVSLIAGSYGFLMLGAIIGLINLILFMFLTETNKVDIKRIVKEMSYISEITLIGGLAMISVGTYLGGVWANESWGRYWGWDAKETWALVTILVYAFILHMRLIPKLNNLYNYNLAKLFGWASVIMTYFGVNYYLSGLHSYAAGDPVPIPNWVYVAVVSVAIVSIIARLKYQKVLKNM